MYKGKIKKGIFMLLAATMLFTGCGRQEDVQQASSGTPEPGQQNGQKEEENKDAGQEGGASGAMGRYTDAQVELPGQMTQAGGITWDENILRLVDIAGTDIVSDDRGETFGYSSPDIEHFLELLGTQPYMSGCAVTPGGDRLVVSVELDGESVRYVKRLYTADNQVIELEDIPESESMTVFCGSDGWFYGAAGSSKIYRIDPRTGEAEYLFQTDIPVGYMAVVGGRLFAGTSEGLHIFDLEKKELADQDPVLDELLKGEHQELAGSVGYSPYLIAPGRDDDSIYVVTKKGLYHHAVYGNVMEQVIDGSLCSIGDASKSFSGMAVLGGGEQESFLILYHDGTLMRYTYDPDIPTVPDTTVRVFTMYDDSNVRMAVSAFQLSHREVYVKYEVGVSEENGMTKEDALKNLSTQLAAGKGPDVLVMDNIPFESYVEKGVLADLNGLMDTLSQEDPLFEKIVDQYRRKDILYAVPMGFRIPVLAGEESLTGSLETLADLADLMEDARKSRPEGSLLGFGNAQDALNLLSQASSGAWVKADGSLDREAVLDFLTQVKRIYDAQTSGIDSDEIELLSNTRLGKMDDRGMTFYENYQATAAASTAFYLKQPFSAGIFKGNADDLAMYQSTLRIQNMQYMLMPGQQRGACIPSSLLAINQACAEKEKSLEFLKYALSGEFQGSGSLNCAPISRAGHEADKVFPYGSSIDPKKDAYAVVSAMTEDGISTNIEIFWPSEEDFARLDALVESFDRVNSCDERVYQAVIELGAKALNGEMTVEEAVNEIEKKVQLYLAE